MIKSEVSDVGEGFWRRQVSGFSRTELPEGKDDFWLKCAHCAPCYPPCTIKNPHLKYGWVSE